MTQFIFADQSIATVRRKKSTILITNNLIKKTFIFNLADINYREPRKKLNVAGTAAHSQAPSQFPLEMRMFFFFSVLFMQCSKVFRQNRVACTTHTVPRRPLPLTQRKHRHTRQ